MARGIGLERALAPRAGPGAGIAGQKGREPGWAESSAPRWARAHWAGNCCRAPGGILTRARMERERLYVITPPAHARLNMWEAGQEIPQLQGPYHLTCALREYRGRQRCSSAASSYRRKKPNPCRSREQHFLQTPQNSPI